MNDFEKFKEEFPSNEKLYSSFTNKNINGKEYEYVVNAWNQFEIKTTKDYDDFHLK